MLKCLKLYFVMMVSKIYCVKVLKKLCDYEVYNFMKIPCANVKNNLNSFSSTTSEVLFKITSESLITMFNFIYAR